MEAFEASAVVENTGHIRVTGVPFAPGTQVAVVISPVAAGKTASLADESTFVSLLSALDKGRNTLPVGPLNRDQLHDRDNLH